MVLAQVQQWENAEEVLSSINDKWERKQVLKDLKVEFARVKRKELEKKDISERNERVKAEVLEETKQDIQTNENINIHNIQHQWKQANTRDEAFRLFPLVHNIIQFYPKLGVELSEAFSWVDDFLKE